MYVWMDVRMDGCTEGGCIDAFIYYSCVMHAMYVCTYMHVCKFETYVCMYACLYNRVCLSFCLPVVRTYVHVCVCVCACLHVAVGREVVGIRRQVGRRVGVLSASVYMHIALHIRNRYVQQTTYRRCKICKVTYVYTYIYIDSVYVCMYVCLFVYLYIDMHTNIRRPQGFPALSYQSCAC